MKLYLDNERPAPKGWTAVRTPQALLSALRTGQVTHVSLDHDLGGPVTGLDVVKGMAAQGLWPSVGLRVHSGNAAGAMAMKAVIHESAPAHLQPATQSPYTRASNRLAKKTKAKFY